MYRKALLCFSLLMMLACLGCTTVHRAASTGNTEEMLFLISRGSDLNAADENGMTPLMLAVQEDQPDMVAVLLANGAATDLENRQGKTASDMAWAEGTPAVFKAFLDHGGADPDFFLHEAAGTEGQARLKTVIREYRQYRKISNTADHASLSDFETWFSDFPEGVYRKEVEHIFGEMIRRDYEEAAAASDPKAMKAFIDRYSDMGRDGYRVDATSLNIRNTASAESEKTGRYLRGNVVHALQKKDGWAQTDRGWVSLEYLKPVPVRRTIPLVAPYIENARHYLAHPDDEIHPEKTPPALPTPTVRQELELLLKAPTLSTLETFIIQYKDRPEYAPLVQTARNRYKQILLDE
ncbi:hypothetical protein DENIS_4197 [Desulfonema ishimotonii]|uniref:Uncharacterized protein n=1 Tax=Desulfonema ishimotonii TaxID=45657 RepID=A0A401G1Z4_9BACT|nr:ankyrin repeat domain-containing protein [Desulfonema ishimotonii]GBC63203.1 hypothetical protein DENIS_4197 [Desulfonema ishimotonii]